MPPASLPRIYTALKMGNSPSDSAPVDGCARTLSCAVVVPATGGRVGMGVGGGGVTVGGAGIVGGRLAVTSSTVGVGGGDSVTAQPALNSPSRIRVDRSLEFTS